MTLAEIVGWVGGFEAARTARRYQAEIDNAKTVDQVLASMRAFAQGPARRAMSELCGRHMDINDPRDILQWWTELEGLERDRNVPPAKAPAHRALRDVTASAWERAVVLGYKIRRIT